MDNISQTRAAGFTSEGTFSPDNLIAGDFPVRTAVGILLSGQNVVRGTVLGAVTASGKVRTSLTASGDGSESPRYIAAESVDATAGDRDIVFYTSGDFNANVLVYGASHTFASIRETLRGRSIHLSKALPA